MKTFTFFVVVLLAIHWCGCSKDTLAAGMLEWKIGESAGEIVEQSIKTADNTAINFSIVFDDLCPTYGVMLIIKTGDLEVFRDSFEISSNTIHIDVPTHTNLEVISSLYMVQPSPLILCTRQGSASCRIDY